MRVSFSLGLVALMLVVTSTAVMAADESSSGKRVYTNASLGKPAAQPGLVYTNEALDKLPSPQNSQLPVAEEDRENPPVGTVTGDVKIDVPTQAAAEMKWVEDTVTRQMLDQRIGETQRRISEARRELGTLERYGTRSKGSVAGKGPVTPGELVSRGVADQNTPQRLDKRDAAARLEAAQVELDRLLELRDRFNAR